ncbi:MULTISPECIES: hypothetical protein [unclassified Clostridium]|nr:MULTISPECIES: hypothetical protein [unclassified Clostridium]MBX9138617.1 hypothetical protein [Clostridium sp. K12(2020)]MBX9145375.1 hypothetical protein [Clostridium sp. K13]MDU4324933.1 hypothetical protein [Clostridium celatum]
MLIISLLFNSVFLNQELTAAKASCASIPSLLISPNNTVSTCSAVSVNV